MDETDYDALYSVLVGAKTFGDWPKTDDKELRQRIYRKWKSGLYDVREIHDPNVGGMTKRIIHKPSNCIVLRKSEVPEIIDGVYEEKGNGARKMRSQMSHLYCGLSRRLIQNNLNMMKQPQKVRPLFKNKAPLRPIKAYKVHERHQVDLVSMPVTISSGETYKYIMSVIDIFQ